MPVAEFEEKEYELQFNIQLAQGHLGKVWSAGQVLEGIVGYDGVADADIHNIIWSILKLPRPKGIILIPNHWPNGSRPKAKDLNKNLVTLVLQYKRPEYLYGTRAAQWRLWGKPYFRFKRTTRQHSILTYLERQLGVNAIVRYVAPAFWTRSDFEANTFSENIIQESGFVSPVLLGRHKVWTYSEPGNDGRGNPTGKAVPFETSEKIRQQLNFQVSESKSLVLKQDLFDYAIELGELALYRQPVLRKRIEDFADLLFESEIGLSHSALQAIKGIAAFTNLMTQQGASYHLVAH